MHNRIIFISILALILFTISLLTAVSYTYGFRLHGALNRGILITGVVFPIVYFASLVLSRNGFFGAVPYTIINILAGIAFYLFIGAIVLGIGFLISTLLSTTLPIWIVTTVFSLSLALSAIGFIQATQIRITEYSVTLANAPEAWNGKRAVLVSDTHFGLVNHRRFSDKVVSSILALQPDFVLHAGDFYDGPKIDTAPITESWKNLTAHLPVFYAPGNHEAYGDYATFIQSIKDADVTVLDNKKVEFDGVQIGGITFQDGKDNSAATASLATIGFDMAQASILINHPPTSLTAAESDGVDLMVSGHTHNGQFWPNTYFVRRTYGIYFYGLKQFKSMQVITSDGVGTYGPPMRLFNSPELVVITFKTK